MKQISVTITVGKGSEKHNHDLAYRESLDHTTTANRSDAIVELIPYECSYEEKINDLMRPYIDEYNATQQNRYQAAWDRYNSGQIKTKPRKANYKPMSYEYYKEHKDDTYYDQKTQRNEPLPIWRSLIFGLGDKADRANGTITEYEARTVCENIVKKWPELYPDFKLLGATLHLDEEGFYHMHVDYKPMYKNNKGQGLSVGIGQEAALEHMGYEPEQSLINGSDKIPIRFNAFRNRLYIETEKELNDLKIRLMYGASAIKEPGKDSAVNQRLENWQATRDAAFELQKMKNNILEIVTGDEVSPEGFKNALEAYDNINETLAEIDKQPRSRINKENVVVSFKIFDQLKSFIQDLIKNIAHLLQQLDIANEIIDFEREKNSNLEKELETLRPLKKYNTNEFKTHYANIRSKAQRCERAEKEAGELRKLLGIEEDKNKER